jgi:hypothetical protein
VPITAHYRPLRPLCAHCAHYVPIMHMPIMPHYAPLCPLMGLTAPFSRSQMGLGAGIEIKASQWPITSPRPKGKSKVWRVAWLHLHWKLRGSAPRGAIDHRMSHALAAGRRTNPPS